VFNQASYPSNQTNKNYYKLDSFTINYCSISNPCKITNPDSKLLVSASPEGTHDVSDTTDGFWDVSWSGWGQLNLGILHENPQLWLCLLQQRCKYKISYET
jgi:hypothetical protein